MKTVFYTKCRPQGSDGWPIARQHRIAFVGYPAYRQGFNPEDVAWRDLPPSEWLVDPGDPEWKSKARPITGRGYRAQVTTNRRLAQEIGEGSVVVVPRVSKGACYAGFVTHPLRLADDPHWATDYLELRRETGLSTEPEAGHVADVSQIWSVVDWITIPFPAVPRWISYRFLSRNTAGIVGDLRSPQVSAHEVMADILSKPEDEMYSSLVEGRSIERTLLDWLSPRSFEHLLVDLLQLEDDREVYWHHVGGSGDGGVDGIAVDDRGKLRGVLQAKLSYGGSAERLARQLSERYPPEVRVVVAVLHGNHRPRHQPPEVWDRPRIASLVESFGNRIPALARFFMN